MWSRVIGFFEAYIPRLPIVVPPLEMRAWRTAVKRFKPQAATGVDGLPALDLKFLPDSWLGELLAMLNHVESGQLLWPRQIAFGTVISIAKRPEAHCPSLFRPVVVFSTIYRVWSGLRARNVLDQLAPIMEDEALGFLRGKEAPQAWMHLQGLLETCAVLGEPLCGASTDLQKAFEHIPRRHTFALARHLGIPETLCRPWESFLAQCRRAFLVSSSLSEDIDSVAGMPEGDALSVLAMTLLDMVWHTYMRVYSPRLTTTSYVDNLGIRGSDPAEVLQGIIISSTFFATWGLQLDLHKTFTWTNSSQLRKTLKLAPYECVSSLAELGGCMVYDGRLRNSHQIQRMASLDQKWQRLKFSKAPMAQKLAAIPIHFWPKALHGAPSCRFGAQHLGSLRVQALRALRLNKAGINSLLRLSLSTTPMADPGLYQLVHTVLMFQRMCQKMQRFVENWATWMALHNGHLGQGPYSKLCEQLALVGWSVHVPCLHDHDGVSRHLLWTDPHELKAALHDAWLQHISTKVVHRKTMFDLKGLDVDLLAASLRGKNAHQLALLGSLHAGAFVDAASHAKFDLSQSGLCPECHSPDTQQHWLQCPRKRTLRLSAGLTDDLCAHGELALRVHLLPSRCPVKPWLKLYFARLSPSFEYWAAPTAGWQHVFTDGSCMGNSTPVPYASWAVVLANVNETLAAGHLAGLVQSSDRAEITAVLAALDWATWHGVQLHLWVDSKFVVDCVNLLIRHGTVGRHWAHQDLWQQVLSRLEMLPTQPRCTWIPSHWDVADSTNAFEDWIHCFNSKVDQVACDFNDQRPELFLQYRAQALSYHTQTLRQLNCLERFYFACAAETSTTTATSRTERDSEEVARAFSWVEEQGSFSDLLPVDVGPFFNHIYKGTLPVDFVQSVLEKIRLEENLCTGIYQCSYIEFVFLWQMWGGEFPYQNPSTGAWAVRPLSRMLIRPTPAQLVRLFRGMFYSLRGLFVGGDPFCYGLNRCDLGITFASTGVMIGLTSTAVCTLRARVTQFTGSWPIREARDMARPL